MERTGAQAEVDQPDPSFPYKKLEKIGEGTYGVVFKAQVRGLAHDIRVQRPNKHREEPGGGPGEWRRGWPGSAGAATTPRPPPKRPKKDRREPRPATGDPPGVQSNQKKKREKKRKPIRVRDRESEQEEVPLQPAK